MERDYCSEKSLAYFAYASKEISSSKASPFNAGVASLDIDRYPDIATYPKADEMSIQWYCPVSRFLAECENIL